MEARKPTRSTFVSAGEVRLLATGGVLSTVLGSCVSVCLWSSEPRLGAANHYLLPASSAMERSARFGDEAIEQVLALILREGASRRRVVAKVFGGAAVGQFRWNVGAENVLAAWGALQRLRVPVVASDVGGERGRHLDFDVATGKVLVRYLNAVSLTRPGTGGTR